MFTIQGVQGTFLVKLEGDRDHLLEELQQPGLLLSVQALSETASENRVLLPNNRCLMGS